MFVETFVILFTIDIKQIKGVGLLLCTIVDEVLVSRTRSKWLNWTELSGPEYGQKSKMRTVRFIIYVCGSRRPVTSVSLSVCPFSKNENGLSY